MLDTQEAAEDLLGRYRRLNSSYPTRMIYQFGRGNGFGAEFVGLIKAMMLALHHGIQFQLGSISRPRGFVIRHGWRDYFEEVFPEVRLPWLGHLNRMPFPLHARAPLLGKVALRILQSVTGARYLMANLPYPLPAHLRVASLGIDGDYHQACRALCELVWRPLPVTKRKIAEITSGAQLPTHYVAAHIRRGDKKSEAAYVPLELYRDALSRLATPARHLFVASDDPLVAGQLALLLPPEWRVLATNLSREAYDQARFNSAPPATRWAATVDFLAEVEIMRRAELFLGSETSNVTILLRMLRGDTGVVLVD